MKGRTEILNFLQQTADDSAFIELVMSIGYGDIQFHSQLYEISNLSTLSRLLCFSINQPEPPLAISQFREMQSFYASNNHEIADQICKIILDFSNNTNLFTHTTNSLPIFIRMTILPLYGINFARCQLGRYDTQSILELFRHIPTTIDRLDLSENIFSLKSAEDILRIFSSLRAGIKHLNLSGNRLFTLKDQKKINSDELIDQVITILKSLPLTLETINLSNTGIDEYFTYQNFGQAFSHNISIQIILNEQILTLDNILEEEVSSELRYHLPEATNNIIISYLLPNMLFSKKTYIHPDEYLYADHSAIKLKEISG